MALLHSLLAVHPDYVPLPSSDLEAAEASTPLASSPHTDSADADTLIGEDPIPTPKRLPRWMGRSNTASSRWSGWAAIVPRAPRLDLREVVMLIIDYGLKCHLCAAVSACYTFAATFLGFVALHIFNYEPYASQSGSGKIMLAGAVGGGVLSVAFFTLAWGFNQLENSYEAAYKIYQTEDPYNLFALESRSTPMLAHRYRGLVIALCVISDVLVCGIVGPAVGNLILVKHGVIDATLTIVDAIVCGAAGTGVVTSFLFLGLSVLYVTDGSCCYDD